MSEQNTIEQDSWAVVEQLGHNVFAGRISEHVIGGSGFVRVDVPALPERKEKRYGSEYVSPAVPAFTKLIGAGSIYAITPCTEDVALKVAEQKRAIPVTVLDLQLTMKQIAEQGGPDSQVRGLAAASDYDADAAAAPF